MRLVPYILGFALLVSPLYAENAPKGACKSGTCPVAKKNSKGKATPKKGPTRADKEKGVRP